MQFLRFFSIRLAIIAITLFAIVVLSYTALYFSSIGDYTQLKIHHTSFQFSLFLSSLRSTALSVFQLQFGAPVPVFLVCFLTTLFLSLGSVVLAALIGLPIGIMAAIKKRNIVAQLGATATVVAQATPSFAIAIVLQMYLAVDFHLFPVLGWGGPQYVVLPLIALAFTTVGYIAKFMQAGMNEVIKEDFIVAARARGVPEWKLILRHALRPSIFSVLTYLAPQVAMVISNTYLVESVFDVRGVSQIMNPNGFDAISQLGFAFPPGIQGDPVHAIGMLFILGAMVLVFNLIVDITYCVLNPRIQWFGASQGGR